MRKLFLTALLGILAATAHAGASPAEREANPKAAAIAQTKLGEDVLLYSYQSDGDGAYTAYLYPDTIQALGGGWYSVVSRHRSQRTGAEPYMLVSDWVFCGSGKHQSVMSALALFNSNGSLNGLKDTHPYAKPAELSEETINELNAVGGEDQHTAKMIQAVCGHISAAK
ncbi:hypothetical protein A7P98_08235 [Eikenella sp. NML080894]|uniref:hypothetical protein n=1 Tax=Eikenella TaxID=538 RepID=UPI0007DF34B6|nr:MULTISPECIES: hypothetical protein [Eikenella]OAM34923.1 hypothetical protein A7P98_08235 [Eikenella sp. NML080894]OAM37231.1 hypothetical protein A7P99_07125 [Eikenella sp. NML120348]OAM45445.1 hypothetical protein A7Q03_05980 [Eikenella sp. NML99-0057]